MAVTVTYDAGLNTNKKMTSWTARGKKMAVGQLNFSGLTYIDGGVTTSFEGFSTLDAVFIENQGGYVFAYDYSNGLIEVREPGTATATSTIGSRENALQELASGTDVGSYTAVRFFAVGD